MIIFTGPEQSFSPEPSFSPESKKYDSEKFLRKWLIVLFIAFKNFKKELNKLKNQTGSNIETFLENFKNLCIEFFNQISAPIDNLNPFDILNQIAENREEINEFLININSLLCLIFKEANDGIHRLEIYIYGEDLLLRIYHENEVQEFIGSFYAGYNTHLLCNLCRREIAFTFDYAATLEKYKNFFELEIPISNIPLIPINNLETKLENYLDEVLEEKPRYTRYVFEFILLLIVEKFKNKLKSPLKLLEEGEKQLLEEINKIIEFFKNNKWFIGYLQYINSQFKLTAFSKIILENLEKFVQLIKEPPENISELSLINILELENLDYKKVYSSIAFFKLVFSSLQKRNFKEEDFESFLKSLSSINQEIKSVYLCLFCTRIYILLNNKKYICLGEDYLEISEFIGEEITTCFKGGEENKHQVIKIYLNLEELSYYFK